MLEKGESIIVLKTSKAEIATRFFLVFRGKEGVNVEIERSTPLKAEVSQLKFVKEFPYRVI